MEEWKNIFKGIGVAILIMLLWAAFLGGLVFIMGLAN